MQVDTAVAVELLCDATTRGADDPCRVAFVDHNECIVLVRQVADLIHRSDIAVHREDAVGDDDAEASGLGFLEYALQVFHVRIFVAVALGLTEAYAVDDGGMVQRVADDSVFRAEEGLEDPAVSVEAGGVEDGVFGVEVAGDSLLKLLVDVLRTADEADGAHPEAVAVHGGLSGCYQTRMVGETEVVIGAEVDDLLPRADLDVGSLRGRDDTLPLVEAGFVDGLKFLSEVLLHVLKHSPCFFVYSLLSSVLCLLGCRVGRAKGSIPCGGWSRSYRASWRAGRTGASSPTRFERSYRRGS